MRIGTETIHRWIYAVAQVGEASYRHLRRARRRRRRQTRYDRGRRMFPGCIDISRRPQVVANRFRFGDWEADLVCASKGKAVLVSCNERKSRFLVLARVENKTANASDEAFVPRLCEIPPGLRKTLTLDNGSEMARFKELERTTGCARTLAGRIRPGSVGRTKTRVAFCGSIFQGESASTRSRKRWLWKRQNS